MAEATSLSTQAALRGLLSQVDDIDANVQLGQDELSDVRSYALARLVEIQAAILAQIDFVVNDPINGLIAHLPTVGPVGPQGPQGYQGIIGNTGQRGPQGDLGPAGAQGASGAVVGGGTGPQGNDGAQGHAGVQGPPGATGAPGINGNNFSSAVYPNNSVYTRGSYATPYAVTSDSTTWQMLGQSFVTGAVAGPCYITANLWIQTRPGVSDPSQRSGDYDFHIHIDANGASQGTMLGENHVNDYMGTAQIGFWYELAPNTTYTFTVNLGNNGSTVPLFIYQARLQVTAFGFAFTSAYP